mmetsp:Transcript_37206/g.64272  ORF Transcript_37206/g.64272 Transcript_37206/m.64272 type:complete len:222 (-) Transcript_37206:22-687(-)
MRIRSLAAICSLMTFLSSTRLVFRYCSSFSRFMMSCTRSISIMTSRRSSYSFSNFARRSFSSNCWSRMVNAVARCAIEFNNFTTSAFSSSFFSAILRIALFLAISAISTSDFLASITERFSSSFILSLRSLESFSLSSLSRSACSLSAAISASVLMTDPFLILFSSSAEITMDEGAKGPVTVLLPFVMVPLRPLSFPNRLSSTWDVCATERYIAGCVWSTK